MMNVDCNWFLDQWWLIPWMPGWCSVFCHQYLHFDNNWTKQQWKSIDKYSYTERRRMTLLSECKIIPVSRGLRLQPTEGSYHSVKFKQIRWSRNATKAPGQQGSLFNVRPFPQVFHTLARAPVMTSIDFRQEKEGNRIKRNSSGWVSTVSRSFPEAALCDFFSYVTAQDCATWPSLPARNWETHVAPSAMKHLLERGRERILDWQHTACATKKTKWPQLSTSFLVISKDGGFF